MIIKTNCNTCSELLTEANWSPSFQKRNVGKCKHCHYKCTKANDAKTPGASAKRTAAYRERFPEKKMEWYNNNKEHVSMKNRERLHKIKVEALTILGGCKCVACGIEDIRCLQINHKNGGGTQEGNYGSEMYLPIIKGTRSTDDLEVRCANCNVIYEYECGRRQLPDSVTLPVYEPFTFI